MRSLLVAIALLFICTSCRLQLSEAKPLGELQGIIDKALAAGATQVVIPPGRYVSAPRNRVHLTLENLTDVEIIADGVELVCTETTRALNIYNCRNLTLRGLTIDYDPLPFTQGRIVALSEDKRIHTVELMSGYPAADEVRAAKYEIYGAATRELATMTYFGITTKVLGPRRLQVIKQPHAKAEEAVEQVGDLIVIATVHAPGGSIPHAVYIDDSEHVTLANVSLYASNTFGFFETNCKRTQYLGCQVDRRSAESDPISREQPRLRSLNADAFHCKYATVGPLYRDCLARYMGDDGIAINGNYHLIMTRMGTTLRVVGKMGREPDLEPGDLVELVDFNGLRLPDARLISIRPGASLTAEERTFIGNLRLDKRLQEKMMAADSTALIELDREVELPMGSLIAAANRLGGGFEIVNCTIGPNRSRGILAKASHGAITGNQLVGSWGEAIKVAPEYWWLEAGSSSHITIADNLIAGCHDAGIAVYAENGSGKVAPAGSHRDIQISGNRISGSPNPGIIVTSTLDLQLSDNRIVEPNNALLPPWKAARSGRPEDPTRTVYLENVR